MTPDPMSLSAAVRRGAVLCALLLGPAVAAQSVPDWAAPSSAPPPAAASPTPGTPGGGVGVGGGATNQVPIDGGLGLLALAGGAYAVRRLRQR